MAIAFAEDARLDDALSTYEQLVTIDPNYPHALGNVAYLRAQRAQWNERNHLVQVVDAAVALGQPVVVPLVYVSMSQDPAAQLRCAMVHAASMHPERNDLGRERPAPRHDRIRVAYVSADFHDHATAYLTAGLLEQHDRSQFEVTAISLGPDVTSAMQARIRAGVERFIDARGKSDFQIAVMMRELQIDIAVDLMGYTGGARADIFAYRAAPVQVNYLGYPGTLGTSHIDYILADRFVIPEEAQCFYTEKAVYLPDSFQSNDARRVIAETTPSRAEAGLPKDAFVFCSFNNTYKINPEMFDIWMRLLQKVEGSVLWLLGGSATIVANFRREAEARGIASERLVFATKLPYPEHLARYRLADLFLDTLPFNAGATASDALWAGLPVLTCAGEAFAARMAGSLLHNVGLPELVTHALSEYEARAAMLAGNPDALHDLRARLAENRLRAPLFDTDRFRQHLEVAYRTMCNLSREGALPRALHRGRAERGAPRRPGRHRDPRHRARSARNRLRLHPNAARPSDGAVRGVAFVEKPDLATAQRYLAEGGYFWNSGMFVLRPRSGWRPCRTSGPTSWRHAAAWAASSDRCQFVRPGKEFCPVPERVGRLRGDGASPERRVRHPHGPARRGLDRPRRLGRGVAGQRKDGAGNVSAGDVAGARQPQHPGAPDRRLVGVVGVDNVVVVETPDAVLVADPAAART